MYKRWEAKKREEEEGNEGNGYVQKKGGRKEREWSKSKEYWKVETMQKQRNTGCGNGREGQEKSGDKRKLGKIINLDRRCMKEAEVKKKKLIMC